MLRPFYPLSLGSGPFWSALLPFWSPLLVSLPLHPRVSAPLLGFMFPRPPGVPPAVWLPLPAWGSLMLTGCIGLTDTDCLPRTHWLPSGPCLAHRLGLTAWDLLRLAAARAGQAFSELTAEEAISMGQRIEI